MTDLEYILNKPLWLLTPAEIYALPKGDQKVALDGLWDMAHDGNLAMFSCNPPGTTYRVENDHGRWKLEPICPCSSCREIERRFVDAYLEYTEQS